MLKNDWKVIKMTVTGVLGIQNGETNLYDYEVLTNCETEKKAYKSMQNKAKELNLYAMKYKHLKNQ